MEYNIQLIEKEKWQNYEAHFSDFADSCYSVKISHESNVFSITMTKEPLLERKIIRYPQRLFNSGHADIMVWGVIDGERLVAGIETGIEGWSKNPRLYISLLWVDDDYKRKGIASALVDIAKKRAVNENLRAVYLDTWSCNEHAIDFYTSQGFKLIGFDSCANSNEDIDKYNVPLKFGYYIKHNK